jgi:hypothetical protein
VWREAGAHETANANQVIELLLEGEEVADIEEGTISRGTMRPVDLLPAFLDELEDVDPQMAERIEDDILNSRLRDRGPVPILEIAEMPAIPDENDPWWSTEHPGWFIDEITDQLNANAPEGMYFGAHPGDASDFGWWRHEGDEDED